MASEDAPNPKLTAILRDDLKKNERDYYIWHTRKDEKVRDKHAEREGKIFNWHVPPEGGHPGEDYNCRCWAEPYRAEITEQFNITPKFDLSGLPQYAENDKAGVVNDAIKSKKIDYSLYGEGFSKEFIDQMENDEEFQKILNEYIIPNEGGYINDSDDSGGETNMGIAKTAHNDEDIKNLTRERANAIYYRDYYNWNGLNKLPYPIRGFVIDYGLPTNPLIAIRTVHKVLNLPPNGTIIGKDTLGKFENYTEYDYNQFLEKYRAEMKKHFNEVAQKSPQKRKFLKGWLNRADGAHLAK